MLISSSDVAKKREPEPHRAAASAARNLLCARYGQAPVGAGTFEAAHNPLQLLGDIEQRLQTEVAEEKRCIAALQAQMATLTKEHHSVQEQLSSVSDMGARVEALDVEAEQLERKTQSIERREAAVQVLRSLLGTAAPVTLCRQVLGGWRTAVEESHSTVLAPQLQLTFLSYSVDAPCSWMIGLRAKVVRQLGQARRTEAVPRSCVVAFSLEDAPNCGHSSLGLHVHYKSLHTVTLRRLKIFATTRSGET
eukprot:117617-Amphidinium_carterae.1